MAAALSKLNPRKVLIIYSIPIHNTMIYVAEKLGGFP